MDDAGEDAEDDDEDENNRTADLCRVFVMVLLFNTKATSGWIRNDDEWDVCVTITTSNGQDHCDSHNHTEAAVERHRNRVRTIATANHPLFGNEKISQGVQSVLSCPVLSNHCRV